MVTNILDLSELSVIPPYQESSSSQLLLDGYLRRDELAEQLRVSSRTIDRWQTSRCGPPRVAIGRTILYNRESVRQWLHSNERDPLSTGKLSRRKSSARQ